MTAQSKNKQSRLRRWLKWLGFIVGGLILLLFIALGITQTGFFKRWISDKIESMANETVNGRLEIGELEGNLFTNISLNDLYLIQHADTLASIQSVHVTYSLRHLLSGTLHINSLVIDSPYVKIARDTGGHINLMTVMPPSNTTTPKTNTTAGGFAFSILLDHVKINSGQISLLLPGDLIPEEITGIALSGSGEYGDDRQRFELSQLHFTARQPNIQLEQLAFIAERSDDRITITDFRLQTRQNRLAGKASYIPEDSAASTASLDSRPLEFSEFSFALPAVTIPANPMLDASISFQHDSLTLQLSLTDSLQSINMRATLNDVSRLLDATTVPQMDYSATIELQDIEPSSWLDTAPVNYLISGKIDIEGRGFTPSTAIATIHASLDDCIFDSRPTDRLRLDAQYTRGDVTCSLEVEGPSGALIAYAEVIDLTGSPQTTAQGQITNLNLAGVMLNDSLPSDITGSFRADISGLTFAELDGQARVALGQSSVRNIAIDTLLSRFRFTPGNIILDTLFAATESIDLNGSGVFDTAMAFNATLAVQLHNLTDLAKIANVDSLSGSGAINGVFSGTMDSIACDADFSLEEILFMQYAVQTIEGTADGILSTENMNLQGSLTATSVALLNMTIQTVQTDYTFTPEAVDLQLSVNGNENWELTADVSTAMDSIITATIYGFTINGYDQQWRLSDTAQITFGGGIYTIDSVAVIGPDGNDQDAPAILIDGTINLDNKHDILLSINDIHLADVAQWAGPTVAADGLLTLDLEIEGSIENLMIDGDMGIRNGRYNDFAFDSVISSISYHDDSLNITAVLSPYELGDLDMSGVTKVSVDQLVQGNVDFKTLPVFLMIAADSLSLDVIRTMGPEITAAKGFINGHLEISNTIGSPHLAGAIRIHGDQITIPDYGIEYSLLLADVSFDGSTITLDSLRIDRPEGHLAATGTVSLQDNILSGTLRSSRFDIVANKFYLVRHEDYEIQISGQADLSGGSDNPKYGGEITVNRSRIFLPALTGEARDKTADAMETPLLVKATQRDTLTEETTAPVTVIGGDTAHSASQFLNNLEGSLTVKLPRNTHVRSPQMRIELEGEIDVVKHGAGFDLFGTIQTVRGYYELYGRRFVVEDGSITFQGGAEMDPRIDIEAQYSFRTSERAKKTLTLFLTGTANTPSVRFQLDGEEIPEGDALCYLVFGRSCDKLSSQQQSEVAGAGNNQLARSIAANILSDQLTKTIGSKLNLDVVQIQAQENLEAATFVVGKYVTNDLFVSYERGIGSFEDDEIAREHVIVEYELFTFLFLRFTESNSRESGFDVIFKWQSDQ